MFLLTTFIHAHCQGRDHRKLGSWEDEPPWPGAHHQLLVCPSLAHFRDSTNLGQSPAPPTTAIAHRYCRTRTLFILFFCIFPWSGCRPGIILIFDANQPGTLRALNRWWSEFCACGPLSDEEMGEYCLVVVGNKTDLAPSSTASALSEGAALDFINELVPLSGSPLVA
jgi:hypothetical protein